MAHFFGGFFKHIEKPQDTHPPSVPQTFSQYDNEYITYCIEQDRPLATWKHSFIPTTIRR